MKMKKVVCFGDSVTRLYATELERILIAKYGEAGIDFTNAGVGGDSTLDGLRRLPEVLNENPDYVVIGFGMNDALNPDHKMPVEDFRNNLLEIVNSFEKIHARIILLTINPTWNKKSNQILKTYNSSIFDVWRETKVRLVDINRHWNEDFSFLKTGLSDGIHPDNDGIQLICKYVGRMLSRHSYIVLWMYNGNPCACNYTCPYCQYLEQKGHHFQGPVERWQRAFKKTFRNQHMVFYFGHGEPMIGRNFYDVLDMIGSEPLWQGRMISNLSPSLERIVNTRVVKEGRFHINGSFHPYMVSKEKFLEKLLFLREHGVECPVVYVMYPPLMSRFEDDFDFFTRHNFLVHVRRFRGAYDNRGYPEAYTDEDIRFIARYCDDQTIKSMLFDEPSYGRLSWTGVDFFAVNEKGDVGHCDDARPDDKERSLGNIFDGSFALVPEPKPFPIRFSSDGTVDGVSNFLHTGYDQLENNHILDYARKGGVYHTGDGVYYKNLNTDFSDPRVRARYHFPARNVSDAIAILSNPEDKLSMKINRLKFSLNRILFNYSTDYSAIRFVMKKIRR